VPMREDCRNYESRTYNSGEVVRMCRLDLAPDAPWRCPDECAKFSRRTIDAGWTVAPLVPKPTPPAPPEVGDGAAELLDAAEDIINAVGPDILKQMRKQEAGGRLGSLGGRVRGKRKNNKKKKR
jgi:hypothetical protein